jgi:hypothetical protein
LDEVLQVLPPFVEAYLQHFCDFVEVSPVYYVRGRRIVMVLMGSYRWNPGLKEYGVEDRVDLPGVGKFKFVGDGSNLANNREGTITSVFKLLCWAVSDQVHSR